MRTLIFVIFQAIIFSNAYANKPIEINDRIDDFGQYEFPSHETIEVNNANNLVQFCFLNNKQENILCHDSRASNYQRWSIVWTGEYLFFMSSDIGHKYWQRVDDSFVEKKFPTVFDDYDIQVETLSLLPDNLLRYIPPFREYYNERVSALTAEERKRYDVLLRRADGSVIRE